MKRNKVRELINNYATDVVLVIDYDRTLVNNQKQLMDLTRDELIEFQKRGGTIVIASGRPLSGLQTLCTELEMTKYNGHVIAANGAKIYRLINNELLYNDCISAEKLNVALQKLEVVPLKKGIYTNDSLLVNRSNSDLNDEAQSNRLNIEICNLFNNLHESVKIILADTRATTHNYYDEVCSLLASDFNIVKSSPRYIEITNKNVNKGNGIKKLLASTLKDKKYLIGFGDSQNDYEMLQMCDYKVAMDNSTPEIKNISDFIIGSNENDAIGKFIKKEK